MVQTVLIEVGAQSRHLDRDHEEQRVGQAEFDTGQAFEDGDDFAVILNDIAV